MLGRNLRQFFVKHDIPSCRIAAAVSGGVDSTALLLALADLRADGFDIVGAHVNHHLRAAESDLDEAFVRDLCAQLGVAFHVADGTLEQTRVRERGVEAAAREIRYARLAQIRDETNAVWIATAHQKNDQAETVLMRLLTGSGIAGLRGIHPVREDGFLRPLLDVTREEIEAFLHERGLTPRIDRSNEDPRFLRNRVRVIVRELDAVGALASVAEQSRAQWPILEQAIDQAERECTEVREAEVRFLSWPSNEWLRGALLQRHIRRLDPHARDFDALRVAGEVDSIRRLHVTKTLELVRQADALVLRRTPEPTAEFEVELTVETSAYIPEIGATIGIARGKAPHPNPLPVRGERGLKQLIQLPRGAAPRFTVRNRRRGDRFHPLGLAAPKKLKDFLIDRKIPVEARDRLPLLIWNEEIVWVAGVEVSERFKVSSPEGVLYEVWMEDSGAAEDDHARIQR